MKEKKEDKSNLTTIPRICILTVFAIAGLFSFGPLLLPGLKYYEYSDLTSINSKVAVHSTVASVTIGFSMIFECLLDYRFRWKDSLPRWYHILGLMTNLAFLTFMDIVSPEKVMQLFTCCYYSRQIFIIGGLCSYFVDVECPISPALKQKIAVISCALLSCAMCFATYAPAFSWGFGIFVPKIVSLLFIFFVARLLYCHREGCAPGAPINPTKELNKAVISYALILIVIYLISNEVICLSFSYRGWKDPSKYEIFAYQIRDIIVSMIAFSIPGRLLRHKAAIHEHQLQSKKTFVRYVSHEIRTPLNIVYMGLQLIESKLFINKAMNTNGIGGPTGQSVTASSGISGFIDMKWLCDAITDIKDSCEISINTLNDILLYDKIENDNLILEKKVVASKPLIVECFEKFRIQAQQNGVILTCDVSDKLDHVMVDVDVNKMSQVLRNLLSNGIKFTKRGGFVNIRAFVKPKTNNGESERIQRQVTDQGLEGGLQSIKALLSSVFLRSASYSRNSTTTSNDTDLLRIEVRDSGPGISKENQARLFSEIVQFNAAELQNGGGSGVGLWISKSIMDKHGGFIGVTSSGVAGEGSKFFIELKIHSLQEDIVYSMPPSPSTSLANMEPLSRQVIIHKLSNPEEESDQDKYSTSNESKSNHYCLSHSDKQETSRHHAGSDHNDSDHELLDLNNTHFPKAIVVDDSALNRKMIIRAITDHFDEIVEAGDGVEAVQAMQTMISHQAKLPDIIFMDSVMPNMTGIEATIKIRQLGYHGLIVGVTGNMLKDDIEEFIAAGANRVFGKPVQLSAFDEIYKCINEKRIEILTQRDSSSRRFSLRSYLKVPTNPNNSRVYPESSTPPHHSIVSHGSNNHQHVDIETGIIEL